ncbi:hypothetical protein [Polaribacter atrinae]|uniref:hypothetical protein n=1 Tax=Polaribacter atrinae TaxID=1333662 RepID=UPI0024922631|nr:hypothetical protein [Polaribacter atrinae]
MIVGYKYKKTQVNILLFVFIFLNGMLISVTNFQSLYSYVYTFVLFCLINEFLKAKSFFFKNLLVLNFFIFLSILLYWGQYLIMPDWFGFTGMYGGVGTDDSRFFAAIASSVENIPRYAMGYIDVNHSFVDFLKILYPFKIVHPLTILFPNLLGICFIPYFTERLSFHLTNNLKVSRLSFLLVVICPVILSNGLILMRDGWVAFLTIAGVFYLLKRNNRSFIIILIILFFIRPGSAILLLLAPVFYFKKSILKGKKINKIPKVVLVFSMVAVVSYLMLPFLTEYLAVKGLDSFERASFVETTIKKADAGSIIYKIYTLPIYLKIPIGFVFFLFLPFFQGEFYTLNILNIRTIMFTTIMPILSLFYFRYFFSGVVYMYQKNEKEMKLFLYLFCFFLLIISQASIQPRHKTALMPFFYIFVAYGVHNGNSSSKAFGTFVFVFLFVIQFYMTLF